MDGGWPGYLSRLREAHRPVFGVGQNQPIVYQGCSCGGLCPIPLLLLHVEDCLDAYDAKVQDFAAETRRVAQHKAAIQRLMFNGVPSNEIIEARYRDDPKWHPYKPIEAILQHGWAPPIEADIIRECYEAEFGTYAWSTKEPVDVMAALKEAIDKRRADTAFMDRLRSNIEKHGVLLERLAEDD